MTTFEICIDSVEGAIAAEAAGADRVELCSALFDGGLTPSIGTIETALRSVDRIRVHVIVRPRAGDFIYSPAEVDAMVRDVQAAVAAGAHGVVIGALTPEGDVDVPTTRKLIEAAGDVSITFHRAFDMVRDPFQALEQLVELGVHRVLTSGQEVSVLEGAPLIAELVRRAGDRIVVMPGGGITPRNIARIIEATGAREYHFAALVSSDSPAVHRNPRPLMGGTLNRPEYERSGTSGELVGQVLAAARG
ncbi:copper homeostasis protein CutC [Micromonospora echinaurantiaca]|jgi:copper homeostasis protein|uniref:copper homeostasis protein CutC n=1 Tax=Micromonospora TaxID=1873 RepID=UPI000D6F2777|nr:copper homeostasis protein CutC [Micromonospora sp. S4605]PWU54670.1 copper homeostasis protein CutC [Micromonospora sp. S4605]